MRKVFEYVNKLLKAIFIFPIRVYQYAISPFFVSTCRHTPSCSAYAVQAIQEWGVIKGIYLGAIRISKCHPWGTEGYDPVPKKNKI